MITFEPAQVVEDGDNRPACAYMDVDFGSHQSKRRVGLRVLVIGESPLEVIELREHMLDKLNAD